MYSQHTVEEEESKKMGHFLLRNSYSEKGKSGKLFSQNFNTIVSKGDEEKRVIMWPFICAIPCRASEPCRASIDKQYTVFHVLKSFASAFLRGSSKGVNHGENQNPVHC